jgi:hypothetical protein
MVLERIRAERRCVRWLLPVLALAAAACSRPAEQTAAPVPAAVETPSVQSRLAELVGSYRYNDDTKAYVFTDKRAIEAIVGTATDQTVRDLVNCLDDRRPSRTVLKGEPVAVGVVCYEALTQTVYYEPTAPNGDIAATWPGHIEPTATAEQLAAAKRAWTDVVDRKAYKRL